MLKKISNWTFGSIFRTIGRFIAYIIIGVLISLLFIKKDYVKASTVYTPSWINNCSYRLESGNTWYVCSYSNSVRYVNINSLNGKANYYLSFGTAATEIPIPSGATSFKFNLYLKNLSFNDMPVTGSTYCQPQTTTSAGTFYKCFFGDTTQDVTITDYQYFDISLQVKYYFNNDNPGGYSLPCYAEQSNNDYIVYSCPLRQDLTHVDGIIVGLETFKDTALNIGYQYFINFESDSNTNAINNQTQQQAQQHNETMQTITGEVNGTGENGTITDEDAESASCGIICKLKHLIKMLSIDNIKYLVIPTEEQMNDLFEQMQTKVTSKLGILGLPITVYTRLMQIAMQYDDSQSNWCLQWDNVPVPNFEDYNIIQGGQWCFSDILANQKINTFRTVCITIIGGLILLSFIQYLFNCLHRILDVPIQDNYEYFTVEDVTTMDPVTGEVRGRQHKVRRTQKLEVDE